MFIEPRARKCIEWMNQHILLNDKEQTNFTLGQFYSTLAVVCYSHNAGCLRSMSIDALQRLGRRSTSISLCKYVITHMSALPATVRREYEDAHDTWEEQLDQTAQLTEVERIIFTPAA